MQNTVECTYNPTVWDTTDFFVNLQNYHSIFVSFFDLFGNQHILQAMNGMWCSWYTFAIKWFFRLEDWLKYMFHFTYLYHRNRTLSVRRKTTTLSLDFSGRSALTTKSSIAFPKVTVATHWRNLMLLDYTWVEAILCNTRTNGTPVKNNRTRMSWRGRGTSNFTHARRSIYKY